MPHDIAGTAAQDASVGPSVCKRSVCLLPSVTKGQRVWLWGNAIVGYVFCLAVLLDASSSGGNVDMGIMCDVGHTVWPGEHGGT